MLRGEKTCIRHGGSRGFTIMETLVVAGILAVLLALTVPNLIETQRDLRQKELDAKAETIYVAVQNQLVKLRASGRSKAYAMTEHLIVNNTGTGEGFYAPRDMIPKYEDGKLVQDLHYFRKNDSDAYAEAVADAVMTSNTVDEELLNAHWVIEYDPTNCNVYAVFYSEAQAIEADYKENYSKYDDYRYRDNRYNDGALVGYYGGNASAYSADTSTLKPMLTVENKEKLSVHAQCVIRGIKSTENVTFTLKFTDDEGNARYRKYETKLGSVKFFGSLYSLDVVLDDLSSNATLPQSATRFANMYGAEASTVPTLSYDAASKVFFTEWAEVGKENALVPGSKLRLELTVSCDSNLIESGVASAETNSLFADSSTKTEAHILYGRHLQNLDESSKVSSGITSAVQAGNISFKNDSNDDADWHSCYSSSFFNGTAKVNNAEATTANFKPIVNNALNTYDGGSYRIAGLNCSLATDDAALFGSLTGGAELKNVSVTGANVSSPSGAAAALVGSVSGDDNKITNCRAYLERSDYSGKTDEDVWVSGSNAGGLVGRMTGGTLALSNSLASTVIEGSESAGGLVGIVEGGTLDVTTSYADSYLTGRNLAGLANGHVHKLANCYAAGFLTADVAAYGLVNGAVDEVASSYTICVLDSSEGVSATLYSTAASIGAISNVYYFNPGSAFQNDVAGTVAISTMSSAELKAVLGDSFTTANTNYTSAYNLQGQALITYTYPRLAVNRHYGDWRADFESGSLVYYEKYADGSYGFFGANVSALVDNQTIVGDGYGVAYKQTESVPQSVTVQTGGASYALTMTNYLPVTAGGVEYRIYPLPKEATNAVPTAGAGFFQEVRIQTSVEGSAAEVYGFNPHFAKAAVRATVDGATVELPSLEENEAVAVRTPRHLYNMSKYYDDYLRAQTAANVFEQECDLIYSAYDWYGFTTYAQEPGAVVGSQEPIGRSADKAFAAVYNGGCHTVTDVSFISEEGNFVGLFGYNVGTLNNTVVATQYNADKPENSYLVKRKKHLQTNEVVYMGVLAGFNAGSIQNCAVAGYYLAGSDGTLHAYENSTLYAGGIVGSNTGTIRNSTADCPTIRLSSLYAQVRLGGFVGYNGASGRISNCYDLAYVEVAESRGGKVNTAGFAGANDGRISSSYCATAIVVSGESATSYAFAPKGGVVSGCYYLDKGTYRYIHNLYTYRGVAERTSGQSATYENMRGEYATNKAAKSLFRDNTSNEDQYPFRAVLKDASGAYVHYGDWVYGPMLGEVGVFYWEYEEGGSNSGYHLTYLGTTSDMSNSGTTLCTAHDDGGTITDYGYGYYVDARYTNRVSVATAGLNTSMAFGGPGSYNVTVAAALQEQIKTFGDGRMNEYAFYPYTTRVASGEEHIYLQNGEAKTGTLTITFRGEDNVTTSHTYEIAPFFANAMRLKDSGSPLEMTSSDWRVTDYSLEPGLEDNVFEVRSVQQLQYINWNYKTKNCDTLVYGEKGKEQTSTKVGNYMDFPYLQYATVLTKGTQKKSDVVARRPERYWAQSHDLHGASGQVLTPIAGMATSTPVSNGNYQNILFAWFGGSYDGQSYKIQNVTVESEAYTVGLFGATAGATIQNVIMFANDGSSKVERATAGKTAVNVSGKSINFEKGPGAYCLGGLIGMAYEYQSSGSTVTNSIRNCAIAGYQVVDSSTNQQGAGTANVGGLIGFANVNLVNCSSVVQTIIASTHEYGHMAWGSYYRIGGLAGSAGCPGNVSVSVKNCYTGGSIVVADETLSEVPDKFNSEGFALRDQNNVGYSSNLFVAGIIGGSYAPNISNFSNQESNSPDGIARIENCYTYLKLPALEGTIRSVSLIAGQADRYCRKTQIHVSNCYYLEGTDAVEHPDRYNPSTWPEYYFAQTKDLVQSGKLPTDEEWGRMLAGDTALISNYNKRVISEDEFQAMLKGNLTCLQKYLNNQSASGGKIPDADQVKPISYEALCASGADMLNKGADNGWGMVTVTDYSGAQINGKYSFSSEPSQVGKNYPFPTIITQKDNTYSTKDTSRYVNVHYGAWPLDGWYWENGRDSMDIFESMGDDGYARKTFVLHYKDSFEGDLVVNTDNDAIAVVESCVKDEANSCYYVTIRAVKDGYVTVRATAGATIASFVLDITAKLSLSGPTSLELYKGEEYASRVSFTAGSSLNPEKDYSTAASARWSMGVVNASDVNYFEFTQPDSSKPNEWSVASFAASERLVSATYTYDYGNVTYTQSMLISTHTKGVVGLANNTDFNEASRVPEGAAQGTAAYITDMDAPANWQMYLYSTASDTDFSQFEIQSVSVAMAEGSQGDAADYDAYFRNMSEVLSGATYNVLQGYVVFHGTGNPQRVVVTVQLKDPNGNAQYELSIPVDAISKYTVHFDSNGGDGTMEDVSFESETDYTLPPCGFSKTGYTFGGWEVNGTVYPADDTEHSVHVGDYTIARATWVPNVYTLHFDSNGGTGSMADAVLTYDQAAQLPLVGNSIVYDGHLFAGWNTAADGTGTAYDDGATVQNLVTEGELKLYAQWVAGARVTLKVGQYGQDETTWWDDVLVGTQLSDYVPPTVNGWELDGWYTAKDSSGVKVLDANGTLVTDSDNSYVNEDGNFEAPEALTLYARWKGYGYLQVNALSDESASDGTYVVANGNTATPLKMMSVVSNAVSSADVTPYAVTVFDAKGDQYDVFIAEVPDASQWEFAFHTKATYSGTAYEFYSIRSKANGKYVRGNSNGALTMENDVVVNRYTDRQVWCYGAMGEFILESQQQAKDNYAKPYVLSYNSGTWNMKQGNVKTYLFKGQDVYSYAPVPHTSE